MRKRTVGGIVGAAVLGSLLLPIPSLFAGIEPASDAARRYRVCMSLAEKQPLVALESAVAWREGGGGDAARHCSAAALMRLGQHIAAADEFEDLAATMTGEATELRASLWGQAGLAHLMADQPNRAADALAKAVGLQPDNVDFRIDRAIALVSAGHPWEAIDDLNAALEEEPTRVEALVLRASAYRKVGGDELARDDLARALALEPENPEALLERGILRRSANDPDGARADWLHVLDIAPGTSVASSAQSLIQSTDLRVEGE